MLPRAVMRVSTYMLTAAIWKEPEGYVAKCSEMGVASAGDSPSDTLANVQEVTELYLGSNGFFRSSLDNRGTES
jgi:predicted RNase H-like HicB family nuclease